MGRDALAYEDIEHVCIELVELVETWPKGWPDIDECFDAFKEKLFELLDPYSTGDYRNYN